MRIHIALTIAVLSLSVAGCVNRGAQDQAKRTEVLLADTTKPVTVAPVRVQQLIDSIEITGEVTTSTDVRVGPKSPGKLVSVYVNDGDPVSAGQVLAIQDTSSQMIQLQQAQASVSSMSAGLSQALSNARLAPARTAASVASAEAQLRSAKAQLEKANNGARPEERAQAEAQVNAARSNMETAQKEAARQKELFEAGAASKQRMEQAENAYRAAKAQFENAAQQLEMMKNWARPEDIRSAQEAVRQAQAALDLANANKQLDILLNDQVRAARAQLQSAEAQLRLIRQSIDDATIRSPISGKVSGIPAQAGQYVGPGEPVARIVGQGNDYFEGEVPESAIRTVRIGSDVAVRVESFPGRVFAGKVAAISPSASDIGRLFRVRVSFVQASSDLRPGMFATGTVTIRKIFNARVVPAASVLRRSGQDVVFIVKGDTAEMRPVKIGIKTQGLIEVSGVSPGEQVVVTGQTDLDQGSKVKLENNNANAGAAAQSGS